MSTQNDNDSANHQASDQPISSHQEHGGIIDKIKEGIDEAKESLRSKLSDTINELGKAKTVAQSTLVGMELDDIQAIILRDRPIPYYGTVVAIKVHHAAKGRELIAKLLPHVSSSQEFDDRMASNLTIVMTYEGLKQLGVPQDSLDSFPENFKQGMAARAKQLHDVGQNAPENWQKPFGTGQIHVCAAVIADSKANWQKKLQELKSMLDDYVNRDQPDQGAIEILLEHEFGVDEAVKNVFGFRDGIGNPNVAGSGVKKTNDTDLPIASGEFVMGYKGEAGVIPPMPQPEVLGKNGSFMVLRKYHSHVADFNKYCLEQTYSPEEADKLAAKIFGRWRSGASISIARDHDDKALGADEDRNNDFDYSDDDYGKGCPFGAHARRMNPRKTKDFILADVRLHRIIRRSVSYGDIVPPHITEDDGKDRGLFFIGINAHAMDTLEFLQGQWVNDGNFMNIGEERDPLIGVHNGDKNDEGDTFTEPADPIRKRHTGIFQFNTVQGGEYLFVPSLSALKWISELSTQA